MSSCPSGAQGSPPAAFTVADIFRKHGDSFLRSAALSAEELRAFNDIINCRTATFGGHVYRCNRCGYECQLYNSCRNRHCPTCQGLAQAEWLEARKAELLPVPYFHNVFSLPHEFNDLALANKVCFYNLLFRSVSEILLEFGRRKLKGTLGVILILHTWDQQLSYHTHLHALIPHGALAFDGKKWNRPVSDSFLFDVKELGAAWRTCFLKHLRNEYRRGKIRIPGSMKALRSADAFERFLDAPSQKTWVVFSRGSLAGPEYALEYLSRYTRRVAISNSRILDLTEDQVTISYLDRKRGNVRRELELTPHQFMSRFFLHILPWNFYRIRHYGIFANCVKARLLSLALVALDEFPVMEKPRKKEHTEWLLLLTGIDVTRCPKCLEGQMECVEEIPAPALPKRIKVVDVSAFTRAPPTKA